MLSIFSSFSWDLYAFFGGLALLEWIMNEYNTGLAQRLKRLPAMWETWIQSLVGKIPWRRKWQPTLVFLPREFHGQRSLVGCKSIGSQTVRHDLATEHTHKEVYTLRLTPKLSIIKEL